MIVSLRPTSPELINHPVPKASQGWAGFAGHLSSEGDLKNQDLDKKSDPALYKNRARNAITCYVVRLRHFCESFCTLRNFLGECVA